MTKYLGAKSNAQVSSASNKVVVAVGNTELSISAQETSNQKWRYNIERKREDFGFTGHPDKSDLNEDQMLNAILDFFTEYRVD